MSSRRRFLKVCLKAVALAALPCSAQFESGLPWLAVQAAQAKEGGNGNGGNGGGNGNGGNGNGNGGGNNGGGNGNSGASGNAGGKGGGKGGNGNGGNNGGNASGNKGVAGSATGRKSESSGKQEQARQTDRQSAPDTVPLGQLTVERRHRNGVRENIAKGRYEMRDARGRTIINRRATEADRGRFQRGSQ